MRPFDEQLVSGNIVKSVWRLVWPVALLSLVNGLHGFIDHVLVGHFVGYEANAGIGIAWQVFLVIIVFLASLFHGMSVLVARYAGKQDREVLSNVVYQTLLACVFILGGAAPAGYFVAPYVLDLVNATPEVAAHALPYIRILFVGGTPIFLMFMLTGAMQASGDPRTPLALGVLATVLNVILSIVLITGIGGGPQLGARGAALATCIAPLVSVVIALLLILRGKTIIRLPKRLNLVPDFAVLRAVARIGLPTGVQGVLLNVGGVILLRYIGALENGAAAQAVFAICYAQLFSIVAWPSRGLRNAAATLMGQNIGAGKTRRGRTGVHVAAGLGALWALGIGATLYLAFPRALLGLFDATEEPVFGFGVVLLRYLALSGVFLAAGLAYTGGLNGAGDTRTPMYIAFFTQIVLLLALCHAASITGRLTAHAIWMFVFICQAARFVLTYAAFRRGKWSRIKVEFDET